MTGSGDTPGLVDGPAASGETARATDAARHALGEALRLSFGALRLLMLVLLVAYAFSGLFSVGSNEVALRLRFGDYVGNAGEQVLERGTYLAAPFPIEQVITIDTRPQSVTLDREFWYGSRGAEQGRTRAEMMRARSGPVDPTRDGSLLTGDLNVVHARWTATYRVADAVSYLTNVGDPLLARDLVRCSVAQGIVHTVARLPADGVLRAAVDRDAAAAIARERLAEMATGLTVDQITLDEVSAPASVIGSVEAVTTAETERAQKIVGAEQDRARILGESAGEASRRLAELIDAYERASDGGFASEAAAVQQRIDVALDDLEIEGVPIGGEVARLINTAKTHRSRVVEEVRADREAFERLLPEYEQHPRLVRSRLLEECRERIFTGDVETFYTAPGRLELQVNRDPEVLKRRQQDQMRGAGKDRPTR
jgi:regulator of protease activity HflC (stomatin/prohibitin superfamily)